jgi:hypothetical protein
MRFAIPQPGLGSAAAETYGTIRIKRAVTLNAHNKIFEFCFLIILSPTYCE